LALKLVNIFEEISPDSGDMPNAFSNFLKSLELQQNIVGIDERAYERFVKNMDEKKIPEADAEATMKRLSLQLKELDSQLGIRSLKDTSALHVRERLKAGDFEGAECLLLECLENNLKEIENNRENTANISFELGIINLLMMEYKKSEEFFKQAVQMKPDFYEAYNNYGVALMNIVTRTGLTKNGNGFSLFEHGRTKEAIDKFKKAIELRPNSPEVWHNLGLCLRKLGKYTEASEMFEKATEVNPSFVEAFEQWGKNLFKLERFELAGEKFREANKIRIKKLRTKEG